jgi:hypothetical protein
MLPATLTARWATAGVTPLPFRHSFGGQAVDAVDRRGGLSVVGAGEQDNRRAAAAGSGPGAGPAGRLRLRLRPTRTAPVEARRALRRLRLPRPLAHDALLLVSELVSNSVRHAGLAPTS